MRKTTFSLDPKSSVSLSSLVNRWHTGLQPSPAARAIGFVPSDADHIHEHDLTPVLVETGDPDAVRKVVADSDPHALEVELLTDSFISAPVITGIVALMLQKNPKLDVARARQALQDSARHDDHTGPARWDPAYGHGKVDVVQALQKV